MLARPGIAVLFVAAMCPPLPATVLNVKPDGTGDHTEIQAAIDAVEDDGIVLVHPGTYLVEAALRFEGKAVTVLAVGGPAVTEIRPAAGAVLVSVVLFGGNETRAAVLDGFTVTQEGAVRDSSAIRVTGSSSPMVMNSRIIGGSFGLGSSEESSPAVGRCTIVGKRAAVRSSGTSSPQLVDCLLVGGRAVSPHDDEASGLLSSGESRPELAHCTVSGASLGIRSSDTSAPKLESCIVWGSSTETVVLSGEAFPEIAFSCTESPWPGEGNIVEDPGYCAEGRWDDAGTPLDPSDDTWTDGDYRVKPDSPCLLSGRDGGDMGALLGTCSLEPVLFRRGDVNEDGALQIADPVALLNFLFSSGFTLDCPDAADVDDSGSLDITDAVYSLAYQFLGGPEPEPPFPACGPEEPDALACEEYGGCSP